MRPLKCECGTCNTCRAREHWRQKKSKAALAEAAVNTATAKTYPMRQEVIIWECSDGREFSSELEATQHQLGIYRNVLRQERKAP